MATWLIPALKAVLPHIGTIISAKAPAFTRKHTPATSDQPHLLQQQSTELQTAASQNATHVKELAEQLQNTVAALEQAAFMAEEKHQHAWRVSLAAMAISALSLCAIVFHLLVL